MSTLSMNELEYLNKEFGKYYQIFISFSNGISSHIIHYSYLIEMILKYYQIFISFLMELATT